MNGKTAKLIRRYVGTGLVYDKRFHGTISRPEYVVMQEYKNLNTNERTKFKAQMKRALGED